MKLALEYGRSRQSALTGWIHGSHHCLESWETIPIFENLCFVVALLRSHVMANTLEGRALLQKILAFQIPFGKEKGLFPRYLHEFPHVDRKGYLISIVLALYLLQSQHKQLLQVSLQKALHCAFDQLLQVLQKQIWMDSLSLLLRALREEELTKESLLGVRPTSIRECIYLLHLTQILFLQKHPAAAEMFHHITSYWSQEYNVYLGPLEKERYHSSEEPISLFHFFMRKITKSPLPISPGLVHLHASLFYLQEEMPDCIETFPAMHPHWKIEKNSHILWQICTTLPEQVCPGFHLFRILWKDEMVHTAVCQQLLKLQYQKIDLRESVLTFEGIPEYGVEIYFRKTKETKIYSGDKRATCFSAGEWITIDTGNKKLCLQFESPGAAPSIATLSMHHRPAELQPDSTNVDWRLSIRVLATDSKDRLLHFRIREGTDCPWLAPLCVDHYQHTELPL